MVAPASDGLTDSLQFTRRAADQGVVNRRLIASLGTLAAGTAAIAAALRARPATTVAPEHRPIGTDGPAPELALSGGRAARSADGTIFTIYS